MYRDSWDSTAKWNRGKLRRIFVNRPRCRFKHGKCSIWKERWCPRCNAWSEWKNRRERRQLERSSSGHNLEWLTVESDTWKMSEPMKRAVRHLQKNRNSGRLKSVVASELEEEVVKKNAWEKEVSDLEKHQTAAAAATADTNRKLRKLSDSRASAESFLERTEGHLEKYEKQVADATEAEEDIMSARGELMEISKKVRRRLPS